MSEKNQSFTGNNILERMQELLIEKKEGWFVACIRLNDKLVEYLREKRKEDYKHPTPNWEKYPIARDFFTQLSVAVKV